MDMLMSRADIALTSELLSHAADPVIAAWERRAKRAALVAGPMAATAGAYAAGRRQERNPQRSMTFLVKAPGATGRRYAHEAQRLARDLGRGPSFTGARGGRYYITRSGANVYLVGR
jgi:hypothetical protein